METQLNELQQMRQQLAAFKQQLDRQQIVNDRILSRAMSGKAAAIRARLAAVCAVVGFGIVYCPYTLHALGCSWALSVVTALFLVAACAVTIYERRAAAPERLMGSSLVDAAERIARIKRLEKHWQHRVGWPFLAAWLPWLLFELLHGATAATAQTAVFIAGIAAGGIIGGLIGFRLHKRNMRDADDMLRSIADLTAADPIDGVE